MASYGKESVLAAAHTAGEEIRAERARLIAEYDAKSVLYRFFSAYLGPGRPTHHALCEEKTANRLIFKASNAAENSIELTDYEIDVLTPYWGK